MNIVNFKKNIYEESKISEILIKLGCENVKIEQSGKIYTAGLPGGSNKRSVQVRNDTYLNACIRSKGIDKIDIFDIVSYIKFGETNKKDMSYSRNMSINWVKKILNIDLKDYTDSSIEWAKEVTKKVVNKPINENVLNQYFNCPIKKWIDEGINYDTQVFFKICYNLHENQIIIPIYNKDKELIGVKARNLDIDRSDVKYIYPYPCQASSNLFGLYIAKKNIEKDKQVILFEGEKSVMKAFQYGYKHSVALGCQDLTMTQLDLINEYIDKDTKIILALDKDVYFKKGKYNYNHLKDIAKMFKDNEVYSLIDYESILGDKDSPIDKGKRNFVKLLDKAILVKDLNNNKQS